MSSCRPFLAPLLLLLGAGATVADDYNVVASVNGKGITRERLQTRVDATIEESGLNYGGITRPQQFKQIQRQALDLLIAQELLWQTAEREGFVADTAEIDAAGEEVRRDFPSDQALASHLKEKFIHGRRISRRPEAQNLDSKVGVWVAGRNDPNFRA